MKIKIYDNDRDAYYLEELPDKIVLCEDSCNHRQDYTPKSVLGVSTSANYVANREKHLCSSYNKHLPPEEYYLALRYCSQWPEGPQLESGPYLKWLAIKIAKHDEQYRYPNSTKNNEYHIGYGQKKIAEATYKTTKTIRNWCSSPNRGPDAANWHLIQKLYERIFND